MQYLGLALEIAHALETYGPGLVAELRKILAIVKSGGTPVVSQAPTATEGGK